jgi:hypothetical protein
MASTLRVRGVKKFEAKIQDIKTTVRGPLLKSALEDSYRYGRRIMPKSTKALMRGFQVITRKKTGTIRQISPIQNRENPRPYHLWLYGTGNTGYRRKDGTMGNVNIGKVQSSVRSGKYNYMELVSKHIPKRVRARLREVVEK